MPNSESPSFSGEDTKVEGNRLNKEQKPKETSEPDQQVNQAETVPEIRIDPHDTAIYRGSLESFANLDNQAKKEWIKKTLTIMAEPSVSRADKDAYAAVLHDILSQTGESMVNLEVLEPDPEFEVVQKLLNKIPKEYQYLDTVYYTTQHYLKRTTQPTEKKETVVQKKSPSKARSLPSQTEIASSKAEAKEFLMIAMTKSYKDTLGVYQRSSDAQRLELSIDLLNIINDPKALDENKEVAHAMISNILAGKIEPPLPIAQLGELQKEISNRRADRLMAEKFSNEEPLIKIESVGSGKRKEASTDQVATEAKSETSTEQKADVISLSEKRNEKIDQLEDQRRALEQEMEAISKDLNITKSKKEELLAEKEEEFDHLSQEVYKLHGGKTLTPEMKARREQEAKAAEQAQEVKNLEMQRAEISQEIENLQKDLVSGEKRAKERRIAELEEQYNIATKKTYELLEQKPQEQAEPDQIEKTESAREKMEENQAEEEKQAEWNKESAKELVKEITDTAPEPEKKPNLFSTGVLEKEMAEHVTRVDLIARELGLSGSVEVERLQQMHKQVLGSGADLGFSWDQFLSAPSEPAPAKGLYGKFKRKIFGAEPPREKWREEIVEAWKKLPKENIEPTGSILDQVADSKPEPAVTIPDLPTITEPVLTIDENIPTKPEPTFDQPEEDGSEQIPETASKPQKAEAPIMSEKKKMKLYKKIEKQHGWPEGEMQSVESTFNTIATDYKDDPVVKEKLTFTWNDYLKAKPSERDDMDETLREITYHLQNKNRETA
ncbi:hypothetical protein ACFLZY_00585 [Patescibacteria group bacterium]